MTFEEFVERYRPIKNHLDPNASYDGFMFETYGDELNHVHSQDHRHVWTYVCEGDWGHITDGFHIVNRMGYFITEEPAPDGEFIEIELHGPRYIAEHNLGFGWAVREREGPNPRAVCWVDESKVHAAKIAEAIADALNAQGEDLNLEHEEDND